MTIRRMMALGFTLLGFSAPATACAHNDIDPALKLAVAEMVDAVKVADLTVIGMQKGASNPGPGQELVRHMLANGAGEYISEIYVAILAPHLTIDAARAITRTFSSAAARQAMAYEMALARGDHPHTAMPEPALARAVQRFNRSAEMRRASALMERTSAIRRDKLEAWARSYSQNLLREAVARIDRDYATVDAASTRAPVTHPPAQVGIAYVDDAIAGYARLKARKHAAERLFIEGADKLGAREFLTPANLASPETVTRNLASIAQVQALNETFLLEVNEADAAYLAHMREAARLRKIDYAVSQPMVDAALDLTRRQAQNRRAMFATIKTMLAFVDSRKGSAVLEAGTLTFVDSNDVAIFNAYHAQLQREEQQDSDLITTVAQFKAGGR